MVATSAAAWHRIRPSFARGTGRHAADLRPIFRAISAPQARLRSTEREPVARPLSYLHGQPSLQRRSVTRSILSNVHVTHSRSTRSPPHVHRAVLGCSSPPHEKM